MKKSLTAAIALLAAVTMAGCGSKAETTGDDKAAPAASESAKTEGDLTASEWTPGENVTMIVAYKAGSGTDNTARVLAAYAEKYIGKTIIIDNKEGGSGSIGWTALSQAKPDGYTLGFVNLPTFCSNIVDQIGNYTMDSVTPISNHVTETAMVLVKADSQFNTLEDLVKYGKENPGGLKASTNGAKASNHIGAQLFAKSADFTYEAIPYGGTADQLLALRQGEVDFSVAKEADFASFPGEIKVLGVFSQKRVENYPDVPTLGESGFYDKWYGSARCIVAPAGTPQEVIDFYADAFKKTMEDPEYIEAATKANMTSDYLDPAQTGKLLQDQYTFCTDEVSSIWDE